MRSNNFLRLLAKQSVKAEATPTQASEVHKPYHRRDHDQKRSTLRFQSRIPHRHCRIIRFVRALRGNYKR
jgi:hypothetical protein